MDAFSRTSGVPLYLQAANALRRLIEREGWGKGTRLPSLEYMAGRFGVARLTMRQAVKKLEQEGVLLSRRGQGIVVVRDAPRPQRMVLYGDLETLCNESANASIEELVGEDAIGCPLLSDAPQQSVYRHWVRVHANDGVPHGFLDIYLAAAVYRLVPEQFDRQPPMPVLRVLPELSEILFRQTLVIRPACAVAARHLRIAPGSPVAGVVRTGKNRDGVIIFVADMAYPDNQLLLDMEFRPHVREVLDAADRQGSAACPRAERDIPGIRETLIKEDFCSLSMLSLSVRLEDSPNGYRGKEGEFRAKRSVSRHT